jgi:glycosyltransferase involved in cell wall biosynthesis
MKVALITTWPPRQCGIATYSRKLAAPMPDEVDLMVVAEDDVFTRANDWSHDVCRAVTEGGADVAHFQHAPDIFGVDGRLLSACTRLRAAGVRVVVTMHTVFTPWSAFMERKPRIRRFHRALGAAVDALVVHSRSSGDLLVRDGVPADKVVIIPHGTDDPIQGDADAGRALLGLGDDAEIVLFFGFIHMQKNIHVLVRALATLVGRRSEARLAVVGKVGGDHWYNHLYLRWLQRLARRAGVHDRLVIVPRFVSETELADVHAASSVVALPHAQAYGSASGVVHGAMAMGLPMLCSDGPKFEEVGDNIDRTLLVPARQPAAWADGLAGLLEDSERREELLRKTLAYAERTRWRTVAAEHVEVYAGD